MNISLYSHRGMFHTFHSKAMGPCSTPINKFIYSFNNLFFYSFINSFIYSFVHLINYSFIRLFVYSFIR